MNRHDEATARRNSALVPIIIIAVLIVLALILLFVWSPWESDADDPDDTIPDTPGNEPTPVSRMIQPVHQPLGWVASGTVLVVGHGL